MSFSLHSHFHFCFIAVIWPWNSLMAVSYPLRNIGSVHRLGIGSRLSAIDFSAPILCVVFFSCVCVSTAARTLMSKKKRFPHLERLCTHSIRVPLPNKNDDGYFPYLKGSQFLPIGEADCASRRAHPARSTFAQESAKTEGAQSPYAYEWE